MNPQLQEALEQLEQAQAQGLPSYTEVEGAPDGKSWIGNKADGTPWVLKKLEKNSYRCTC